MTSGSRSGVREIAVILRVLLASHGARFVPVGVVQPGFLHDLTALFEKLDLPARLEFNGALHEAEGVQVLDLAARAQSCTCLSHGHVGIAAKRAFLHVAVADADPDHQRVQGARVGHRLFRAAKLRLGDDLEERRAGAVEIDAAHAVEVFVQGLAGVFLEVRRVRRIVLSPSFPWNADGATLHDRQLVLADLVALRQVG
jgi:hypothetical protein